MKDFVTHSYYLTDGELHELHRLNCDSFGREHNVTVLRDRRALNVSGRYFIVQKALKQLKELLKDSREPHLFRYDFNAL